jgi:hypothetical protein
MSAHTPGPWKIEDGRVIQGRAFDQSYRNICDLVRGQTPESADANARLIAAAPDLLAALQEALDFAEDREDVNDGDYGIPEANAHMRLAMMLRAAIAKAEGKA